MSADLPERCLGNFLALARSPVDLGPDSLHVAQPKIVYYGCTPWVPERDVDYRRQDDATGAWTVPAKRCGRVDLCRWCQGNPAAAGQMCPGCHRLATEADEQKLKLQRRRVKLYRDNETPLETTVDEARQASAE